LNGKPIKDSPFVVAVRDQDLAPNGPNSGVSPMQIGEGPVEPHKGIVKKPYALKVKLRNKDGQPVRTGHDNVSVGIKPKGKFAKDNVVQDITVHDNHNGTYDIVWIPDYVGEYEIQVGVNGEPITKFDPVIIENDPNKYNVASVRERSFEIQACDTEGENITQLDEDTRDLFRVKFYDESEDQDPDNPIDRDLPTEHVMTNVKYLGDGRFFVSYIIIRPGDYLMSVTFTDQIVAQVHMRA